jgi:hypothetical protein
LLEHGRVRKRATHLVPDEVVQVRSPDIRSLARSEGIGYVPAAVIVDGTALAAGAHANDRVAAERTTQQTSEKPSLVVLQAARTELLVFFVTPLGLEEQLPGDDRGHGHRNPFVLRPEFLTSFRGPGAVQDPGADVDGIAHDRQQVGSGPEGAASRCGHAEGVQALADLAEREALVDVPVKHLPDDRCFVFGDHQMSGFGRGAGDSPIPIGICRYGGFALSETVQSAAAITLSDLRTLVFRNGSLDLDQKATRGISRGRLFQEGDAYTEAL